MTFDPEQTERPLATNESEILEKLLSVKFPGRDELVLQLNGAKARRIDAEGSCELHPRRDAPQAQGERRVPVEAETVDADGVGVHVLLHVVDGYATELAIYREDPQKMKR